MQFTKTTKEIFITILVLIFFIVVWFGMIWFIVNKKRYFSTEARQCNSIGGSYLPQEGLSDKYYCVHQTKDKGKHCEKNKDCEGYCTEQNQCSDWTNKLHMPCVIYPDEKGVSSICVLS